MGLLDDLTLKSRQKQLGNLKFKFALDARDRSELIAFINDEKKMKGIDIEGSYGDVDGSLLLIASRQSDYELFMTLIEKGADILHASVNDMTPADAICIWAKSIDFYHYLKKTGYDFNKPCFNGTTPLALAISKFKYLKDEDGILPQLENIYDFLFENNVDINSNGINTLSPLMVAARFGLLDIIKDLLRRGADKYRKYVIKEYGIEYSCIEYINMINKEENIINYETVCDLVK